MTVIENFRDNFIKPHVWTFLIDNKFTSKKSYLIKETFVIQSCYFKDIFLILIKISIISISTTQSIWQIVDPEVATFLNLYCSLF